MKHRDWDLGYLAQHILDGQNRFFGFCFVYSCLFTHSIVILFSFSSRLFCLFACESPGYFLACIQRCTNRLPTEEFDYIDNEMTPVLFKII